MFHVVLYEPEIPPNTGNIIRLCANTGAKLHLIHPLGFKLDDAKLRRAGLDYREFSQVIEYENLPAFVAAIKPPRLFAISTRGQRRYSDTAFEPHDAFLFGPESRGLPTNVLDEMPNDCILRIPMLAHSRSLNLSNAVTAVVFEAWRQHQFDSAL